MTAGAVNEIRVAWSEKNASISLADDRLTIRNQAFTRVWSVDASGLLNAESFYDAVLGREWLRQPSPGPRPAAEIPEEPRTLTLRAIPALSPVEAESLTAELTATGARLTLRYTFQVFPDIRGVRMQFSLAGGTASRGTEDAPSPDNEPTGIETDTAFTSAVTNSDADTLDALPLTPLHLRLTQVTLHDQTDRRNELVFENEWLLHTAEAALSLSGCLFYLEDVLTGAGLIFLKEAPLPHARPIPSPCDLRVRPAERHFAFVGQGADEEGTGYAFITLAYDGGTAGRIAALQQYQRCLRPYVPGRDGMLVSNTWGDRNRDGRINAEFMAQEIEAGARLGVDVIQIDDGWEAGTTSNSVNAKTAGGVWEGFYAANGDFWAVHPERFPNGLAPLVAAAREKRLRFGLWFAPDSADDFARWEQDADRLLELHHTFGIEYIKIDGVKLRTKRGEANLHAFFDRVLERSGGHIVFDADVTAEVRPGYFGLTRVGPLFVENRYTDWRRYWPHQTLRNLWKLAHHMDPARLRMEWLNHERNTDKYTDDPLAPSTYRPDYLFATVMFSSPLGWFETSNLPESYFTEVAPLIAVWKEHRDAIFSGTIYPIGDAPSGASWTGFISLLPDRSAAYLLLFRELTVSSVWSKRLPFLPNPLGYKDAEFLAGSGRATVSDDQTIVAEIEDPRRFLFARLTF
jgi:alpha-galactosidase